MSLCSELQATGRSQGCQVWQNVPWEEAERVSFLVSAVHRQSLAPHLLSISSSCALACVRQVAAEKHLLFQPANVYKMEIFTLRYQKTASLRYQKHQAHSSNYNNSEEGSVSYANWSDFALKIPFALFT